MRGKEELQVRSVFVKDLKLWLIAGIQSASFTLDSFPQSPTMQTRGGCWHCEHPAFPPTSSPELPQPSAVPSPSQGSCYGKNPEQNAESCCLAVKLLVRNRRYFVLAVQFYTSEQIAAAFDVVCFFQKTSVPYLKGLAGKSDKVNSILVFCGAP